LNDGISMLYIDYMVPFLRTVHLVR